MTAMPSIIEIGKIFQDNNVSKNGIVAAYSFEVETNLNLLNGVKVENFLPKEIKNDAFIHLVKMLQNSMGASIVFNQERVVFNKFLSAFKGIPIALEEETEEEKSKKIRKIITL